MCHRGLESNLPVVRARVFDVIYNLTVHAELLYPSQTTTIDIEAKVIPVLPPILHDPLSPSKFDLSGFADQKCAALLSGES